MIWDNAKNDFQASGESLKCRIPIPQIESPWVFIRKTFAQFLRNETQNFSFFAHQFCEKKQQFAQSFAKVISRKIALFRFCETQALDDVCFLEFNSSSAGRFCTKI